MDGRPRFTARVERQRAQLWAVGIGEGDVDHFGSVVEGRGPAPGAVDQLVGDHQVAWAVFAHQAAGGAGADDAVDAKLLHRPDVGPVRHQVRRVLVVMTMAGDEGDFHPVHLAYGRRCRRGPVGGIHLDGASLVEELVEAGPAKYADHSSLLSGLSPKTIRLLRRLWPSCRRSFCLLVLVLVLVLSLAGLTEDGLERESVE